MKTFRKTCVVISFCFIVASVILLYIGTVGMIKHNDKRYTRISIEKLSSEPVCNTGGSYSDCDDKNKVYKNRYTHVRCSDQSIERPHMTISNSPGPPFSTMRRHKKTGVCQSDFTITESYIYMLSGGACFIISMALLFCYKQRASNNVTNIPQK